MTFPRMVEVVPEGKYGNASVEHFEVSGPSVRDLFRPMEAVRPGKYARLMINGYVMMSDTQMERNSNREVVIRAHGHVLIAGLGLGMILHPILAKESVQTVTVLEKNANVISLIEPTVRHEKLTVIEADVFSWTPPKGTKYNTVYFDIWSDFSTDHLKEMGRLHRRYGRWTDVSDPARYIESWQRGYLKRAQQKDKGFRFRL